MLDGSSVATAPAERAVAAQRAGETPPPPVDGPAAAAAALAATTAASAAIAAVPVVKGLPGIAGAAEGSLNAINTAAAGIIGTFDRFLASRRADQSDYIDGLLADEGLPEDQRVTLVDQEMTNEKAFAVKTRARLDRDLPKALSITDKQQRDAAVSAVLERERGYQQLREDAIEARAHGAANNHSVRQSSPEGAYWKLSDKVKTHTLDCLSMGGKVWPWSILDVFHPPLCGPWCQCELWTIEQATRAGLVTPGTFQTADQAATIVHLHEATVDPLLLDDELELLEAAWAERWWAGSSRPGQFRPSKPGDLGQVLRLRRTTKMPDEFIPDVEPIGEGDERLDVADIAVKDLKVGDKVMIDGDLAAVTAVQKGGIVRLEGKGLVRLGRDTVRGVQLVDPVSIEDAAAAVARASQGSSDAGTE